MSNLSNQLSTHLFENSPVRTVQKDDQLWFVATDICSSLKLKNVTKALKILDETERSNFKLGRQGDVNIINESGMYTLVLRCRDAIKPNTVSYRFRKWVTSEVLPTIRKTGSYTLTINSEQQQAIRETVKNRTQRTGEKYAAVYARFYNHFKIPRYQALPAIKFDEAVEYLGSVNNELVQFTNDELCNMCWCYKASELMRQKLEQTADGMIKLKSDYAASFYTMSIEYRRLLESVRFLLESKTRNIKPKLEGFQSDNWKNVLMFIRDE